MKMTWLMTLIPVAMVLKVAVTAVAPVTSTVHVPVPLHVLPVHPANVDPDAGAAVRVTEVPTFTVALQTTPQLMMFEGVVLVTEPVPVPARVTLSTAV